jgi:hypothetical protein
MEHGFELYQILLYLIIFVPEFIIFDYICDEVIQFSNSDRKRIVPKSVQVKTVL